MNYIKIKDSYINLDNISFFCVDSEDYCIAFYMEGDSVHLVDFDTCDEYTRVVMKLEATIKGKGSLVK